MKVTDIIAEKLQLLPDAPGVYIMKDVNAHIIYVGKAVILKNRVRQYFQSSRTHTPKVRAMVAKIADFEIIMTGSEVEALILECNLIKKHKPRYNISLKDDKTYPYLKVTLADDYPRVYVTRRVMRDRGRYFGPYANAGALRESLKLLRRLFPIRSCKRMDSPRPCLEYHIKRCLAPCTGKVKPDEYADMIKEVCLFMEGRTERVERSLIQRMQAAAEKLEFELAARLRDQLAAVRKISEKQHIVTGDGDQDVIGLARSGAGVCVQVFFIRSGRMVGREKFLLSGSGDETDEAALTAFLQQYYHRAAFIPQEVLLSLPVSESSLLENWLSQKKKLHVQVKNPQRGVKRDLVNMAVENAAKYLADEAVILKQNEAQTMGAVADLGRYLNLAKAPYTMECFDISHIQGAETVASMVVFRGGLPDKKSYRRFKIRSTEGKPDDFLSMREVTSRRYGKAASQDMPDLIIIDGGKGQLSSALAIIRGAGHLAVPVVGLAKQFEYIFVEGSSEPIILPRGSEALYLVQRIRDEAHRFAITYHRKLRGKRNLRSVLDHITGIGPRRRQALWEYFGTLDKMKLASLEDLSAVPSMNKAAAKAVHDFFQIKDKMLAGQIENKMF